MNNQLTENSVTQLLNSVRLARDNAERADNRVDHAFYYALTRALEELQEHRKAASTPLVLSDDVREFLIEGIADSTSHGDVTACDYRFAAELEMLLQPIYAAPQPLNGAEIQEHRKAEEPVGGDELDHLIWGLQREGFHARTLAALLELREVRKAKPVVPDTLPCPVFLEPGLKFGKGVRTQCMLDALNRRSEYHSELDAMTPEQRAEHDAGIDEFKAMLGVGFRDLSTPVDPQVAEYEEIMVQAIPDSSFTNEELEAMAHGNNPQANAYRELLAFRRNSPVTPDGWVMVPVEPTEAMIINGFESEPDEFFSEEQDWEAYEAMSGCQQAAHRAKLCYAAMLAAAPKEVGDATS